MNDPLYDHVPHMVPHTPADPTSTRMFVGWPVGRYEKLLLIGCAIVVVVALVELFW